MGGMRDSKKKGIYVYVQLIHVGIQQKLTPHCKAILLQKQTYLNNESKEGASRGKETVLEVVVKRNRNGLN